MQQLRVDAAGLQTMAAQWQGSVADLEATAAPPGIGSSHPASAAAVNAAHADVFTFTTALVTRVVVRAVHVVEADIEYVSNEAGAVDQFAAIPPLLVGE